jgi:hypothetical protein
VGYKFHHVAQESTAGEAVNLAEPIKNVEVPFGKSDVNQFIQGSFGQQFFSGS